MNTSCTVSFSDSSIWFQAYTVFLFFLYFYLVLLPAIQAIVQYIGKQDERVWCEIMILVH